MTGADREGTPGTDPGPDEGLTVHFLPDYTPTNPYQERLAAALRERGVTVRVTDGGGRGLPILRAVLGNGRPDVVHVHFLHQFLTPSGTRVPRAVAVCLGVRTLLELAVLRLLGVSLVWTAHDLLNHERRAPGVERRVKAVFIRYLATGVVLHCPSAASVVTRFYGLPERVTDRMAVVPHGRFDTYPDDLSQAEARDRLDLDPETTVFTFFGSVRRYKNVPGLVRAVEDLADDVTLLVAGKPRTSALRREVEAAVAGTEAARATLEFIPDGEVQLYLNAADAVVLPFRAEASLLTSGSALLAMGFGRAVVAPDVGCLGDYLGEDGGVLYDPTDEDALRGALERALDADLEAMGARNRRTVAALSWDRVAARTHAVYAGRPVAGDDCPPCGADGRLQRHPAAVDGE